MAARLDQIDLKIIEELQESGRMTKRESSRAITPRSIRSGSVST